MIDQIREGLAQLKNNKESKHEKYLLETENCDKETDQKSSPASNTNDIPQPSTSNNSNESVVQLKSIGETINESKIESSLSFGKDPKFDEKAMNKNAKFTSEDFQHSFSKTQSSDSINPTNVNLNENLSYEFRKDVSDQLVTSTRKEEVEFPRESNNQINRRRVSFTDKLQVNVFEKLDDSFEDKEKQEGESSHGSETENKINKTNQFSNDENTDNSTDYEDEDDIIKIEVKHSDIKPRKQFKKNEEDLIEDPSDIYRIFLKPKSILKRSSGDNQNFLPQAEDTSYQKSEESPAESSYKIVCFFQNRNDLIKNYKNLFRSNRIPYKKENFAINISYIYHNFLQIVKDVEERNPEVLQINNTASKARPVSRFKMARSGMK